MKGKNHTITDSKQQMLYHMFFSSPQYTEPDIVVIYRNTSEMSLNDGDDTNTKISYQNITSSKDTILVLMDKTEYFNVNKCQIIWIAIWYLKVIKVSTKAKILPTIPE